MAHLLTPEPVPDLDAYLDRGGGTALSRCHDVGPDGIIEEIRAAGLRGRGGAGFPTGIKWRGLADDEAATKFVVCNAAEGEPGTFKDRTIIRRNPFQVLEGLAVAAYATGAAQMFVGIKEKFGFETSRVEQAAGEMAAAGLLGEVELVIVRGPDDYLFGEEKGLLEVIEGKDPLPRLFPPYAQGLFELPNGPKQPAAVNNVETLANVPHILANGARWFRSLGTEESPGTVVCTLSGDVAVELVAEVELGTTLRTLIEDFAGGTRSGRAVRAVLNGVSNAPLPGDRLDVPVSYEGLEAAGSGLGSASFIVFDDTACPVAIGLAASRFLAAGSCGQCTPCKLGTGAIAQHFAALDAGGEAGDVEQIAAWTIRVTDANRCGLGAGQRAVAKGVLEHYAHEIAAHLDGGTCPHDRDLVVTTIDEWDEAAGRFSYPAR